MMDSSNALTIQDLIDILSTESDKSKKVYINAFPEYDNCSFYLPVSEDMLWKDMLINFDTKEHGYVINAECETDWFD